VKRIHLFAGGIPRLINVICERCLIGAFASDKQQVDNAIFTVARNEVMGDLTQTPLQKIKKYGLLTSIVFVCALMAASFFSGKFLNNYSFGNTLATDNSVTHHTTSSASSSSKARDSELFLTSQNTSLRNTSLKDTSLKDSTLQNTASLNNLLMVNYTAAEDVLLSYLGFPLAATTRPCSSSTGNTLQCEKATLHNWAEVVSINRPAIIILSTPEKILSYVVLIGINQDNALVINEQLQRVVLPLAKIGYAWTGDIIYLWQKPQNFNEPLILGDRNETVAWIAQEFARVDHQETPLTDDLFNMALQERIKLFQRAKGLHADGIVGQQTLMKINEALTSITRRLK
jgi:general secretion pathway protein A